MSVSRARGRPFPLDYESRGYAYVERANETLARFSPSISRELLSGIVTELRGYAAEQTRNFQSFLRDTA